MFGGSYAAVGASVALVYALGFIASYLMQLTTGEVMGPRLRLNQTEPTYSEAASA